MDTLTAAQRENLSRTIAVTAGKGGVGKTSTTANVAAELGQAGYQVCVVDWDVTQGLALEFGMLDSADQGRALVASVLQDTVLRVVQARPGIAAALGGDAAAVLNQVDADHVLDLATIFARRLAEIAPAYDIILIDCPPGDAVQQTMALHAARWVLVPSTPDKASLLTLTVQGPRVAAARANNPTLAWLGLLLFNVPSRATRIRSRAEAHITEITGATDIHVLNTMIRSSVATTDLCRDLGLTVRELLATRGSYFKALRAKVRGTDLPPRPPEAAEGVARDYHDVAREILTRISTAEQEAAR